MDSLTVGNTFMPSEIAQIMFLRQSITTAECQRSLSLGKGSQSLTKDKASIQQREHSFFFWHNVSRCANENAFDLLMARLGQIVNGLGKKMGPPF